MNTTTASVENTQVNTAYQSIKAWADLISRNTLLHDLRNNARMGEILVNFASYPNATIPEASRSWAATKATYRFLDSDRISARAILEGICSTTAQLALEHDVLYVIHDTTSLNLTGSCIPELGPINSQKAAKGLHFHTSLIDTPENDLLGIIAIQSWVRPNTPDITPPHKESEKWVMGAEDTRTAIHEAAAASGKPVPRIIHVADREADFWDFLQWIDDNDESAVIRCVQNRCVDSDLNYAHEAVRNETPIVSYTIDVPESEKSPARIAKVELRVLKTKLKPDMEKYAHAWGMGWTLVELWEPNPPEGVEGLHWLLWTREPVETAKDVKRVVEIYKRRWQVEEYHKVMKSGCGVERLELRQLSNFLKASYLYAAVAARIVRIRNLG